MAHARELFDRAVQLHLLLQRPVRLLQGLLGLELLGHVGQVHQQQGLGLHREQRGVQPDLPPLAIVVRHPDRGDRGQRRLQITLPRGLVGPVPQLHRGAPDGLLARQPGQGHPGVVDGEQAPVRHPAQAARQRRAQEHRLVRQLRLRRPWARPRRGLTGFGWGGGLWDGVDHACGRERRVEVGRL